MDQERERKSKESHRYLLFFLSLKPFCFRTWPDRCPHSVSFCIDILRWLRLTLITLTGRSSKFMLCSNLTSSPLCSGNIMGSHINLWLWNREGIGRDIGLISFYSSTAALLCKAMRVNELWYMACCPSRLETFSWLLELVRLHTLQLNSHTL